MSDLMMGKMAAFGNSIAASHHHFIPMVHWLAPGVQYKCIKACLFRHLLLIVGDVLDSEGCARLCWEKQLNHLRAKMHARLLQRQGHPLFRFVDPS